MQEATPHIHDTSQVNFIKMYKTALLVFASLLLVACVASTNDSYHPTNVKDEYKLKFVKSVPGSPSPQDITEPHMPGVDILSDMDALFADARAFTVPSNTNSIKRKEARHLVVITPGRMRFQGPMLDPDLAPVDPVQHAKSVLGTDKPLNISVISYTMPDVMAEKGKGLTVKGMNRAIPIFGHLAALAYAGHNIVVFEGHPSAFEAGVRKADVLFIDSAMVPFLQKDWSDVAFRVMNENAKIIIHDRATYTLRQLNRMH